MEIDKWIDGYKVRSFPWIDNKRIFFNVIYYCAGQSIHSKPVWDKTVYIVGNERGRKLAYENTATLTEYVALMQIADGSEVTITVK